MTSPLFIPAPIPPPIPSSKIVHDFQLSDPSFVEKTAIATVWRAQRAGKKVALKTYHHASMSKETPGFDFLRALDGQGAVRVLAQSGKSVIMEWLDGPSLGDITRAGNDEMARVHLVDVACALHNGAHSVPGLTPLQDWCADLFTLRFAAECSTGLKANMLQGQSIARGLFAIPHDIGPLHGDLHHDNIKLGANGWRAFDAKGLFGDRTFELANAFRNPLGAESLIRNPARFLACADLWADRFGVDRARLMRWAAVKVALSIAWRAAGVLADDKEADLLAMMLAQLPET